MSTAPDPVADLIGQHADEAKPMCDECEGPEVLIDGQWFVCPRCHPDTARVPWHVDPSQCQTCNLGGHTCPGCGESIRHSESSCVTCYLEIQRGER
jgi:hypothetical protein